MAPLPPHMAALFQRLGWAPELLQAAAEPPVRAPTPVPHAAPAPPLGQATLRAEPLHAESAMWGGDGGGSSTAAGSMPHGGDGAGAGRELGEAPPSSGSVNNSEPAAGNRGVGEPRLESLGSAEPAAERWGALPSSPRVVDRAELAVEGMGAPKSGPENAGGAELATRGGPEATSSSEVVGTARAAATRSAAAVFPGLQGTDRPQRRSRSEGRGESVEYPGRVSLGRGRVRGLDRGLRRGHARGRGRGEGAGGRGRQASPGGRRRAASASSEGARVDAFRTEGFRRAEPRLSASANRRALITGVACRAHPTRCGVTDNVPRVTLDHSQFACH